MSLHRKKIVPEVESLDQRILPNAAPVAVNDATATSSYSVVIQVLANDTDADLDSLFLTGNTSPAYGSLSFAGAGSGSVTYTPYSGYSASVDTFQYTVSDGTNSSTATVTITLNNSAPVAANDSFSASYGDNTLPVKNNDSDFNGDPLSVTITTPPNQGTASVSGGNVIYNIQSPASGTTATFTYQINDGRGGTSSATVTINLPNNAPVATSDSHTAVAGSNPISVLGNDNDPNNAPISITSASPGYYGSTSFNGTTLYYSPYSPASGSVETIVYTISDGRGGTSSATVTINLPNDAPTAVSNTFSAVMGDNYLNVAANDTDPNNDNLTIDSLVTTPVHGSASISSDGKNIVYSLTSPATASTESFTYRIKDNRGGTSTASVTINLPNNAPTANSDSYAASAGPNTYSVLANDTDVNGDSLTLTLVSTPSQGSATISGNNVVYYPGTPTSASLATFTYQVTDSRGMSATGSVTVTVDRAPVANPNSASASAAGVSVAINVLGNDTDPDGDSLSVLSKTDGSYGSVTINGDNTVSYTRYSNVSASIDSFTYTISDNRGGTSTASVTIDLLNNSPVAVDDDTTAGSSPITINVLANDADPDGDTLSLLSASSAAYGSVSISGNAVVYTQSSSFAAEYDMFTYTISDGRGGTASGLVHITFSNAPVNNRPVFDSDEYNFSVDMHYSSLPATVGTVQATDPDSGQSVVYTISSGNDDGYFAIDSATGEITLVNTPPPNSPATFLLLVTATDDGNPEKLQNVDVLIVDECQGAAVAVPDNVRNAIHNGITRPQPNPNIAFSDWFYSQLPRNVATRGGTTARIGDNDAQNFFSNWAGVLAERNANEAAARAAIIATVPTVVQNSISIESFTQVTWERREVGARWIVTARIELILQISYRNAGVTFEGIQGQGTRVEVYNYDPMTSTGRP